MKWTVAYRPSARDELANIWIDAIDRNLVTSVADEIEDELKFNPLDVGESRGGNRRLVVQPPLAVEYKVDPDDMLVTVMSVQVWR